MVNPEIHTMLLYPFSNNLVKLGISAKYLLKYLWERLKNWKTIDKFENYVQKPEQDLGCGGVAFPRVSMDAQRIYKKEG